MKAPTPRSNPDLAYTRNRQTVEGASSYAGKYRSRWHKRLSMYRERALLGKIFTRLDHSETLLDVPSGPGRLSDIFANACDRFHAVDSSLEMLRILRNLPLSPDPSSRVFNIQALSVASAFHLPFRDSSFDTVVSVRLSHHIPTAPDRTAHLVELLRVARRHVIVSFFDSGSLKHRLREFRRALGSGKRAKYTLGRHDVVRCACNAGFPVHSFWKLAPLVSGHSFAVLSKS